MVREKIQEPLGVFVSLLHRMHYVTINKKIQKYGLSAGQFFTFGFLLMNKDTDEKSMAMHYQMSKGTISRNIKILEKEGFVNKIRNPENQSSVKVSLTEKGEKIAPELIQIDKEWENAIFQGIKKDEKELFIKIFEKVANNSLELYQKEVENNE